MSRPATVREASPHVATDALIALGPPIAASSVPRCPCTNAQPCACERYAHRLEQSQREFERRTMEAATTLRALAGVADGETMRRALLRTADALF